MTPEDRNEGDDSAAASEERVQLTLIEGGVLKRELQWSLLNAITAPVFDKTLVEAIENALKPRGQLQLVRSESGPDEGSGAV